MRVGLQARLLAWLVIVASTLVASILLDSGIPGVPGWDAMLAGAVLVALSVRGAMVTGRYLAVYGCSRRGVTRMLVDVGPYSCMRHPMHFFLALFPLGLGLLTARLGGVLAGAAWWVLILVLAVLVDERDAESRLGEAYREYRARVPAYSLHPKCLAAALGRRPPRSRCHTAG